MAQVQLNERGAKMHLPRRVLSAWLLIGAMTLATMPAG